MTIHRLILRDFVIVQSLDLDVSGGFTALTGETGAGKSILIDAIQMALGERANADLVRAGAARADVALEFDRTPAVDAWLLDAGFETEDHLLVRRTVDTAGKSRAWINGSAATAAQLRELADHLVDIHGQHAWAMLTRASAVRDLLDAYAQIDTKPMAHAWSQWRNCLQLLELARSSAHNQSQERERLEWQISEVSKLNPLANEWAELSTEHARLTNAQGLIDAATQARLQLTGGDDDLAYHAAYQIHLALAALQAQTHIEPSFQPLCDELASSLAQVEDAAHSLQTYLRRADLDPLRLAQLDARLGDWLSLARRFKCAPDALHDVFAQWTDALEKLDAMGDLGKLEKEEQSAFAAFESAAKTVSQARNKTAPRLGQSITAAMQTLGMTGGKFEVCLSRLDAPAAHGLESAEFLVAGHAGASPKPIGKVASGGELSRIALALAVTTSKLGNAPTLIFDEVDAGIGGATALTVGKLMQQLGADKQVLAVTHLPQVASQAHQHGVVSKFHAKQAATDAPCSRIEMVTGEARAHEIARMLGSANDGKPSDAALAHAQEMLAAT